MISRAAPASRGLSHSALVFVTCSVEESGPPAAALMSAERVHCHVAKLSLSLCRHCVATRPRHLRRSCHRHPGLPTCDITPRPSTLRDLTRRTLPAVLVVVVRQRWQRDRHLHLAADVADICSCCCSSIVTGD